MADSDSKRSMRRISREKYCYICAKMIVLSNTFTMKDHQRADHIEDIRNIKKSKDTKDYVKSVCKVCGVQKKVTEMRGHTKSAHGMNITEYKFKYDQVFLDLVELILHKCGICEEYLLLDSDYQAPGRKRFGIPST